MIEMKVVAHLEGLKNTPKLLKGQYSKATEHIAEVVQRAAIRNLRQVSDTGNAMKNIVVVKSGEFDHSTVAEFEYAWKFEKGYKGEEPYSEELMDWAIRRGAQGYLNSPNIVRFLLKNQYLNVNYYRSPAFRFMTRAKEFAEKHAKAIAEYHIEKIIR